MSKSSDLNALLSEATSPPKAAVRCWGAKARIGGDERLKAFVAQLEENRSSINVPRVVEILSREFQVHLGISAVRNHLRGVCTCRNKTT